MYNWPPTKEDYERESAKANSSHKSKLVSDTEKGCREMRSQYERGLLTPLDYAEQCMMAWSNCEQRLRWGDS